MPKTMALVSKLEYVKGSDVVAVCESESVAHGICTWIDLTREWIVFSIEVEGSVF